MSNDTTGSDKLVEGAARIVAAFVTRNPLAATDVGRTISDVYGALVALKVPSAEPEPELAPPAVPIRKSVTPAAIFSLEDGKPYRSLKRHLKALGMTPDQYRTKWGLPSDYPVVAPEYSAMRSQLAKSLGLGRRKAEPAPEPAKPKRGRKKAAETT